MLHVCWTKSKDEAKKTAFDVWPNILIEGSASQELPLPKDFEELIEDRDADEFEEASITLGSDPDEFVDAVKEYDKAGFTHAYMHQVGADQESFLRFARDELLPRI
jgi:hypothetical protein